MLHRYKNKHTLANVINAGPQMIWGCFSGNSQERHEDHTTMKTKNYLECLQGHLFDFLSMFGCHNFLQDGAAGSLPHIQSVHGVAGREKHKPDLLAWQYPRPQNHRELLGHHEA